VGLSNGELDPSLSHNAVATVVIGALRGIALVSAVTIVAEVGELSRSREPRS